MLCITEQRKVVKLNLQVCTAVIVNLNYVCYLSYESHLLKLMLNVWAVG
jgi:hypothetical protein